MQMKHTSIALFFLLVFSSLIAQQTQPADRQCSLLRELIFQMKKENFEIMTDGPSRQSSGQDQGGNWTFRQQKFTILEPWQWQGAASTILENGFDKRPGEETNRWQYIAFFNPETSGQAALEQLENIAGQFDQCLLPQNDSVFIHLQKVKKEEMEEWLPDNYLEAYVYRLPELSKPETQMTMMVALERLRRGFRPVLILEWLHMKKT